VDDALAAPDAVTGLSLNGAEAARADEAIRRCTALREVNLGSHAIRLESLGGSSVTHLRLSASSAVEVVAWPSKLRELSISQCTRVEIPTLEDTPVKRVAIDRAPVELGKLLAPTLTSLALSKVAVETLPGALFGLERLKELRLEEVGISELDLPMDAWPSLGALHLSGNALTELPESIGSLERLRVLSIAGNRVARLPESMKELSKLETLVIEGNPGIENVFEVATALASRSLRRLYVRGARLPRATVQALVQRKRPTVYR